MEKTKEEEIESVRKKGYLEGLKIETVPQTKDPLDLTV